MSNKVCKRKKLLFSSMLNLKIIKMKNSKFENLLAQIEVLSENEQGKLKGGFTALPSTTSSTFSSPEGVNGYFCPKGNAYCPVTVNKCTSKAY